jgi:hypothetical protein
LHQTWMICIYYRIKLASDFLMTFFKKIVS